MKTTELSERLSRLESIGRAAPAPLYVLEGEDLYLRQQATAAIMKGLATRGKPDVSFYHGEEVEDNVRELLDDLRNLSLFEPRRLIVVWEADRILRDQPDLFRRFMSAPSDCGCLVLCVKSLALPSKSAKKATAPNAEDGVNADVKPSPKSRQKATAGSAKDDEKERAERWRKFTTELGEADAVIDCEEPRERDVREWLTSKSEEICGKKLSKEAVELLLGEVGADMARLARELEKLAVYVGDRARIERKDVAEAGGGDREAVIYNLTDAIGDGNKKSALEMLDMLPLARDEKCVFIISGIAKAFRRWWQTRRMIEDHMTHKEIQERLKMHPYAVEKLTERLRFLSDRDILAGHADLLQADIDTKTHGLPERLRLELLVLKLCGRRARRQAVGLGDPDGG